MHPFLRKELPRAMEVGSLDLPTTERYGGPKHAKKAGHVPSQWGPKARKTRVTWPRLDCLKSNPDRITINPVARLT